MMCQRLGRIYIIWIQKSELHLIYMILTVFRRSNYSERETVRRTEVEMRVKRLKKGKAAAAKEEITGEMKVKGF